MEVKLYNKLSFKLFLVTSLILIAVFSVHTYLSVKNLQDEFFRLYKQSAYNIGDIIRSSTRHSMLLNKREDIYQIIRTIGTEPGVKGIRIYNKQGTITFSTDSLEINKKVDINAEACVTCHEGGMISRINKQKDSIRVYNFKGSQVLGLINPIRNEKDCYTSDCHAHNSQSELLGVIDIMISMETADRIINENKNNIILNSVIITLLISAFSGLFILFFINKPIKRLGIGMEELGKANWNYRIKIKSRNELGMIAKEFNDMSRKLSHAYNEIKEWSEKLNEKVQEKTSELKNIYEQVVQIEKLASLGKLSATVAHELNNPLEGILTYSKLVSKKLKGTNINNENDKIIGYLDLIAEESARCGRIVKNLLIFSHRDKEEFREEDLVSVIEKSLTIIRHHFEINRITLNKKFSKDKILVKCDPQKIQQCLISLFINAIESMNGREGTINVEAEDENKYVIIKITDEGTGIPKDILPHIFEPFFTTKTSTTSNGTGLGLSVAYGIIRLHNGHIEVEETSENGTTFKITIPKENKEIKDNKNG